jgi:hypothetical protein
MGMKLLTLTTGGPRTMMLTPENTLGLIGICLGRRGLTRLMSTTPDTTLCLIGI